MEQAKSRQSALILAGTLLSKLMSLVAVIAVARKMGADAVGLVAGAYALVGIFRFIFDAGLPTTHIKKIAEGGDRPVCIGAYLRLKLIATGAGILVVAVAVPIFLWQSERFGPNPFLPVVIIILLARSISSLTLVPLATFTGTGQIAKKQIVQVVQAACDCVFVLLVALFLQDVIFLALAHLLSEIVCTVVTLRLFRGEAVEKPSRRVLKQYIRFSLPLVGAAITESIYSHVDRVMLMSFISAGVVGYYHNAWRVVYFVLMIPTAVSTILMPAASRYLAGARREESARILLKSERYLSLVVAPICAGMAIFAWDIMWIFGPDFTAGAPALAVLAAVCFVYSVNRSSATMLISLGKTKTIFRMTLVLLAGNVLLNALLIPKSLWGIPCAGLGAVGAAVATLAAAVAGLVATKLIVKRALGVGMAPSVAVHPFVAVAAGLGGSYFSTLLMPALAPWVAALPALETPLDLLPVIHAVIGCFLLLLFYAGALLVVGEFGREEIRYVAAAINPRKLWADVRGAMGGKRSAPASAPKTTSMEVLR